MLTPVFLRERWGGTELMDDPESDPERLRRTIRQFRLINRLFSRTRSLLRRWIVRHAVEEAEAWRGHDSCRDGEAGALRALELGGGDGEIARWLHRHLARRLPQVPEIEVVSVDQDSRVHDLALSAADGTPVTLVHGRAPESIPPGPFHYVFGNHFLHHLGDDEIVALLKDLRLRGVGRCLFNDLHRNLWAYLAFSLFARFFLRGSFAYHDGRASIRRGFTAPELAKLAAESGWPQIRVFRRPPGHVVLLLAGAGRGNSETL